MKNLSLELSKQVAHLFPDSEWWYYEWIHPVNPEDKEFRVNNVNCDYTYSDGTRLHKSSNKIICPAPTTDELLESLPDTYESVLGLCDLYITKTKTISGSISWHTQYHLRKDLSQVPLFKIDKSLPNALGKMLIYLDKEKML